MEFSPPAHSRSRKQEGKALKERSINGDGDAMFQGMKGRCSRDVSDAPGPPGLASEAKSATNASQLVGAEPGAVEALAKSHGVEGLDVSALSGPALCLIRKLSEEASSARSSMESLEGRLSSSSLHASEAEARADSLQARLFASQQELSSWSARMSAAAKAHKEEKERLTLQRDEYCTKAAQLQSKDDQYKAALARSAEDNEKLKDRYNKLSRQHDRDPTFKRIEVKGELRGARKGNFGVDGLQDVVVGLEFRQQELLEENQELRASLRAMAAEIQELTEKLEVVSSYISARSKKKAAKLKRLKNADQPGKFMMPMDWVRENISENMREQLVGLKARLDDIIRDFEGAAGGTDGVDEEYVKELERKVKGLEEVIVTQDNLIQNALFTERFQGSKGPDDSVELDAADLRQELAKERAQLDEEWEKLEMFKGDMPSDLLHSNVGGTLFGANTPGTGNKAKSRRRSSLGFASPEWLNIEFEATPSTQAVLERAGIKAHGVKEKLSMDDEY